MLTKFINLPDGAVFTVPGQFSGSFVKVNESDDYNAVDSNNSKVGIRFLSTDRVVAIGPIVAHYHLRGLLEGERTFASIDEAAAYFTQFPNSSFHYLNICDDDEIVLGSIEEAREHRYGQSFGRTAVVNTLAVGEPDWL